MVRMKVKGFLIRKNDKDLQQYSEHVTKIQVLIDTAKREIEKPERASLINDVDEVIVTYQNAFDEVVILIK
ncbi:hypothetical protein L1D41_14250 [Vibrio harveyi]|uniref:hypothetical protein n=1 Tax=Vibrio harveyi TaxID=669 RepID=UPI001EFE565C|nr:hypothetical protein [Vibrio harveyi]MCG9610824.1 hypothetical protein [Vibrio harveyi]MCG9669228.1 hypothetical protein [Vibrio harveyi]